MAFGTILPVALHQIAGAGLFSFDPHARWTLVGTAIALTAVALYVSSVSGSGLQSLVWMLPVGMVALLVFQMFESMMMRRVLVLHMQRASLPPVVHRDLWLALIAGAFVALLLRFAAANHFAADRNLARVGSQVAWIAALGTGVIVLLTIA